MKLQIAVVAIFLLISRGYAFAGEIVIVDPGQKRQTIRGWGVSLCWWANIVGAWPAKDIERIADLLTTDLGYNVFRFNIGGEENPACTFGSDHMRRDGALMPGYRPQPSDSAGFGIVDMSADIRQITVLDALARKQPAILTVLFSNSPPWWMTKSRCAAGAVDGGENLLPDHEEVFAEYLASAAAALHQRNPGWNIRYLEPFNEPLSNWWKAGGTQEGCYVSPAQQARVLAHIGSNLRSRPQSNLSLVAADCSEVAESLVVLRAFRRDHADVLPLLAGIHTHSYKGTSADKRALASEASALGLPVWQSETGPLNWEPKDGKSWWHRHYDIADRMIDDLRDLRSEVWCDWQSVSVDDAWGVFRFKNFREDAPFSLHEYVKNRSFYLRKQVLNFIPPGFRILEAGPAHSIAALAPDEKRLVILVSNPLSDEALHRFDLTRFPASSSLSIIRTSGPDDGENAVDVAPTSVTLESGLLTYSAPQYSLTTLLIDFATRSSPVSETRPTL